MSLYEPDLNLDSTAFLPTGTQEKEKEEELTDGRATVFAQRRSGYQKVEEPSTVHHRRRWSHEDKKMIVAETEAPGASISGVARNYGIAPRLLFSWRRQLAEEMKLTNKSGAKIVPVSIVKELEKKIQQLEEQLERKTSEIVSLKKALESCAGN
jgi:transposase